MNIGGVPYRHKKTGVIYILWRVIHRETAIKAGEPLEVGYFNYLLTDDITENTFVCLYETRLQDATPETPYQAYARAADMFFDGRFERIEEPA